ncbi:DUF1800 domain-containing protein [Rubripirellula amarantea]|nr:DUF1800 domain-containing protein [Rubripirellula amarantea]MDA8744619.1 DUF1800 domain-containing protein [Rubripirellula amarantea]
MTPIDPDWAWSPYEPSPSQPWNHSLAAHLYRRAGFGHDWRMIELAVSQDPGDLVADLVSRNVEPGEFRETADALAEATLAGGDPEQLSAAWVYRLLYTPSQLLEKTTLFWHGHFATGAEKVNDARMMWAQNQLLRDHALGDFAALVHEISKDPAMLIYLDSAVNRKAHPNENFARELMELFCLGEGNYSEMDVQELARCFTGWEIKNRKFRKNRYQHDAASKTVLERSGDFDGEDGVQVVLQQPGVERFIVRKLLRFFVSDELNLTDQLVQPLANLFREQDLQIAPLVKQILGSNLFFSKVALAQKIKSPAELVIGMMRVLNATTNTQLVARGLRGIGQGLFYPPNVKGWDGGRAWINSSTLLGRSNLIADILESDATRFDGKNLTDYLTDLDVRTTDQAISFFERSLFAIQLDDSAKSQVRAAADSYAGDRERQMRSLLHSLSSLPASQLS